MRLILVFNYFCLQLFPVEKQGESPGRGAMLPIVLLLTEAALLVVLLTLPKDRCAGRR